MSKLNEIINFNYAPASYLDVSWLAPVIESKALIEILNGHSSSRIWISKFILKQYGLDNKFDFDFKDDIKQLALLNKKKLVPLIFHAGLCLNASWISKIIKRDQRNTIITCVGKSGFQFAIKKAPYIIGNLYDVIPNDFKMDWNNPTELKRHIFRSGLKFIGLVFVNEKQAFRSRLLFKFPMTSTQYFNALSQEDITDIQIKQIRVAIKKLRKDLNL